jgi:hypothetical protein
MPTQAIAAYGIQLRLGDGVPSGLAGITAASNTAPILITTSVPHGIVDVGTVTVNGVGGNTAANTTPANPYWIAERITATQVRLRGSAGNGTYAGGGNLARSDTYATIAELTNITDAGIQATLVETSAHDGNGWTSRVPTLLSGNMVRLDLNLVPTHPTHNPITGLEYLLLTKTRRSFLLVFPDVAKSAWWFQGFVTGHRVAGPVAGIVTAATTVEMIDVPILAAA